MTMPAFSATALIQPPDSAKTSPANTVLDSEHLASSQTDSSIHNAVSGAQCNGSLQLDQATLEAFVGDQVASSTFEKIKEASGNNMERAINMYLDGSWATLAPGSRPSSDHPMDPFAFGLPERKATSPKLEPENPTRSGHIIQALSAMPECRYIGAFGVGAWATHSGTGLVKMGEAVQIQRTKIKPPVKVGRGGKATQPSRLTTARSRVDVVVRITNARGEEIGRLPKETADWVSPLMDQGVCRFDGVCFLAPERIRVNDTVELQLRCSLLRTAFETSSFQKPEDNNRTTGIFEEKETTAEKDLRMRQVALVKLFDEINLRPSTINDMTAKHKRQGILQAAEIAEQYDKENDSKVKQASNGNSTPPDEEAEEGKELEQDQLDTLYKKAQSFDFNTPAREPAGTFTMDLRKYQKQALHWMINKEKNESSTEKELSMHPLWEEYTWPIKDMDDQDVVQVLDQSRFFVNPYSGELSLDFPVQEQHCLGGILADGKCNSKYS